MSRHWYWSKDGKLYRKSTPKARTAAWERARHERSASRPNLPLDEWQQRDPHGFIPKQVDGVIRLYDPGIIDRYLWEQATQKGDD